MYVLTRRFNALPAGERCVKLVGGVAVAVGGRCAGRYLVVKRGAGVYASTKPLQTPETPIYVAAEAPRRYPPAPRRWKTASTSSTASGRGASGRRWPPPSTPRSPPTRRGAATAQRT